MSAARSLHCGLAIGPTCNIFYKHWNIIVMCLNAYTIVVSTKQWALRTVPCIETVRHLNAYFTFEFTPQEKCVAHPWWCQVHISKCTTGNQNFGWLLLHLPYIPDLTSPEFGLSDPLKDKLQGHHHMRDEALQNTVEQWPQSKYNSF